MSTTAPTITTTAPTNPTSSSSSSSITKKKGLESVVDRPLKTTVRTDLTLSTFNFLFTEMITYAKGKGDIREIMAKFGQDVGSRMLELIVYRDKKQRENQVVRFMQWLQKPCWRMLFGKDAAKLEKDLANQNACLCPNPIFFPKKKRISTKNFRYDL